MAKTDIFTSIGNIVEQLLNEIQKMSLSDKMQELQAIIVVLITLNIMYKGYMVLAGRSQDPIRELVWDMSKKMIIMSFVFGGGIWLNYSIEAIRGIYTWAGGGAEMYAELDKLADSVLNFVQILYDKADGIAGSVLAALLAIIILLCFVAISIEMFFSIISASVTNAFLIIVFPLALFCFMWNQTKQVFTQWCQLLLSNTFTLLFLLLFLKFCSGAMMRIFDFSKHIVDGKVQNFFLALLEVILISFVLIQIIKVIKGLAQNLAQVSLDAVSGVTGMQAAGTMAGKGANITSKAASGAASGGIGLAGKMAPGITKGVSALSKATPTGAAMSMGKAMLSKMRGK